MEQDGVVGFKQFCTIFPHISAADLVLTRSAYFQKCRIKLTCLTDGLFVLQIDPFFVSSSRAMLVAGHYTRLLYVAGVAVNFFLYTVSGRAFRQQLVKMLACRDTQSAAAANRRRAAPTTNL